MGPLGPGSRPKWAILGEDQLLCGWSWVKIRAYVGRRARDQLEKWPKPEREGDLASGLGAKSGLAAARSARNARNARVPLRIFFNRYIVLHNLSLKGSVEMTAKLPLNHLKTSLKTTPDVPPERPEIAYTPPRGV